MNKLLVSSALSFLFLCSLSLAYTEFSHNPYFDSDTQGILLYSNYPVNISYNATYGNHSGVAVITNNGNFTDIKFYMQHIGLVPQQTENATLFGDWLTSTYGDITLPANREGILSLSYMQNYTTYGYTGYGTSPQLFIIDTTNGAYTQLNATNMLQTSGIWENYTATISPASTNRTLKIEVLFSTYSNITSFVIDRFSFYTYDTEEIRGDFFTTKEDELLRYCGNNPYSDGVGAYADTNFTKFNATLKMAVMINTNKNDNNICGIFQSGNLVIGRRMYNDTNDTYVNNLLARDLVFLAGHGLSGVNHLLIKAINLQGITYDYYTLPLGATCQGNNWHIEFNGIGRFNWSDSTGGICGADKINGVKSFIGMNISGDKFRNIFTSSPAYIPFFTFTQQTYLNELVGIYCNMANNSEYFLNGNGTASNFVSCGDCGCSANEQKGIGCNNAGFVGSRCHPSDTTHRLYDTVSGCSYITNACVFDYSNTSSVYGICEDVNYHPDISTWTYPNTTIVCYNPLNATSGYIINATGGNTSITSSTSSTTGLNLTKSAGSVGSLIGLSDSGARALIGIIIIVATFIGLFILSGNYKITIPVEVYIIIFMLELGVLTFFIPLFDGLIFFSLLIVSVILLALKLKGIGG